MKKVDLQFYSGLVINGANLICQTLLTMLVKVEDKTYLVSKDALANFVVKGEESINKEDEKQPL